MSATIINLGDRREANQGAASNAPPRVFRSSPWPMDDYKTLEKHLSALAVMVGSGSLDRWAITELLARYSVNADEAGTFGCGVCVTELRPGG